MEGSKAMDRCPHDGYYSGVGFYSKDRETVRYVLVCDQCGEEMQEVSTEAYAPNPVLGSA